MFCAPLQTDWYNASEVVAIIIQLISIASIRMNVVVKKHVYNLYLGATQTSLQVVCTYVLTEMQV